MLEQASRLLRNSDMVVGYTNGSHASEVARALENRHAFPEGTVVIHIVLRSGRIVQQRVLTSHSRETQSDTVPDVCDMQDPFVARVRLAGSPWTRLVSEVVTCAETVWSIGPTSAGARKPVVGVARATPFCDERDMVDCLRRVRVGTDKGSMAHIAGDRAWLTGGSVRTLPKRPAWADEEDDNVSEEKEPRAGTTLDIASLASASDKGDRSPRPQSRLGSPASMYPSLSSQQEFQRLLRCRCRSASFLPSCLGICDTDIDQLSRCAASLTMKSPGWAQFFQSEDLREAPLPLYLVQLLLSRLGVEELQLWYIHQRRALRVGVRGVAELDFVNERRYTMAINEHGGRSFVIESHIAPNIPKPRARVPSGAEAIVFEVTTEAIVPAETFFLCLDTCRLDCLAALRTLQKVGHLRMDDTLMQPTLSWEAMSQVCVAVALQAPLGFIVSHQLQSWWHVTSLYQMAVSIEFALRLMQSGCRCLCMCPRTGRWRCVQLRATRRLLGPFAELFVLHGSITSRPDVGRWWEAQLPWLPKSAIACSSSSELGCP